MSYVTDVAKMLELFFQAEDGIRDIGVTGVQTCALPICTDSCSPVSITAGPAPCGRGLVHRATWGRPPGRGTGPKSVVWGKRVDLGGRRIRKKKKERRLAIRLTVTTTSPQMGTESGRERG